MSSTTPEPGPPIKVMMSPTQYRRRFGGLKRQLRAAGSALRN
jgi:hypothetical protein